MDEHEEKKDSITCGTATTGAVKVYFDYNKESQEQIEAKADFCSKLAEKLRILKTKYGA